jgi:hypothetical protein
MSKAEFYARIAADRQDSGELQDCICRTVDQLVKQGTSTSQPGILLGRIQSGKTRAFLGVIGLAFDQGYDVAIILTKGTVSLAKQTLNRVREDFRPFLDTDAVQVFDIMTLPANLTPYELNQKMVFVVKKEDDNLKRLIVAFRDLYPMLRSRKVLIVDDEADFASVSYRRKNGEVGIGVISAKIEELRNLVASSDFLQVTATPYSLYLQPEEEVTRGGTALFRPKRPAFTEILPIHPEYVGGDYYFEQSADPNSIAYYFYEEVPLAERDSLKKEDRRRIRLEGILAEKNVEVLRRAIVNFVMGAAIRRLQQQEAGEFPKKYSLLFHTEQSRESHDWQERIVTEMRNQLVAAAIKDEPALVTMLKESYADLKPSVEVSGLQMPSFEECASAVRQSLVYGYLMITKVNSDKDIEELLDDRGQLKLRTPMNLFIGGQILDRGITIGNLIGFYYGRNPKKFQQDTVLQHSRMYGARAKNDLGVTRFYAPLHIYQIMQKIHEFDSALREAFLSGSHDRGVYFIQRDLLNRLVPCSPNKLMFSKLTSIRPGKRLLPIGFQTVAKTVGKKNLELLDTQIKAACGGKIGPVTIPVEVALKLLEGVYENLIFDDPEQDERKAHLAVLEHLSKLAVNEANRGKVCLMTARDRDIARMREGGRFSNAPDTKQQADAASALAKDIPVLMLLRQNGGEDKGWRGLPFWWPVLVVPKNAVTSVFAAETPSDEPGVPDVPGVLAGLGPIEIA